MIDRPLARFEGLKTYTDRNRVVKFRYPLNWFVSILRETTDGIIISPYQDFSNAYVELRITDLSTKVEPKDWSVLRKGFDAGLKKLGNNVRFLERKDWEKGNIVVFERVVEFEQHKCKVWLSYFDHYQLSLIYQAENSAEYSYWYAMSNYSFTTFEVSGQMLWNPETTNVGKEGDA